MIKKVCESMLMQLTLKFPSVRACVCVYVPPWYISASCMPHVIKALQNKG